MDRVSVLLENIDKTMLGVEVGPYFNPLVPKTEGYQSLSLDVFEQDVLFEKAAKDPNIKSELIEKIETVELVGSATDIGDLVEKRGLSGKIDYIISSHNFEHLPNPILFLHGCQRALKPSGFLTMAIPDRRATFDFFRPISTTADFLGAFYAGLQRPTATSIFELSSLFAELPAGDHDDDQSSADPDAGKAHLKEDLTAPFERLQSLLEKDSDEYVDTHCSVFTQSSFELIISDLHYLGVIDLGIEKISGTGGFEFYTRLSKNVEKPNKADFEAKRLDLLHRVIDENAMGSGLVARLERQIKERETPVARSNGMIATLARRLGMRA